MIPVLMCALKLDYIMNKESSEINTIIDNNFVDIMVPHDWNLDIQFDKLLEGLHGYKKINIVNDQVSGWAKKCYSKFAALT